SGGLISSKELLVPVEFNCDHCERSIRVRDELAGKRVKCPSCSETVSVPDEDQPAPARKSAGSSPRKGGRDAGEEDDRPRKRSSRDDDDEDARPRKRSSRDDEDDDRDSDDDRPRKRSSRDEED